MWVHVCVRGSKELCILYHHSNSMSDLHVSEKQQLLTGLYNSHPELTKVNIPPCVRVS